MFNSTTSLTSKDSKDQTHISISNNFKNDKSNICFSEYQDFAAIESLDLTSKNIRFSAPYVSDYLQSIIPSYFNLFVKSDMGTGKTHWLARFMVNSEPEKLVIVVTHLRNLVRGVHNKISDELDTHRTTTQKLEVVHYEDITSNDNVADLSDAKAVFTTVNSLPKVLTAAIEKNRKISLVVDESQSVARFILSDKLKNKESVADALEYINQNAEHVVMMDAHLSALTSVFTAHYMPSRQFVKAENTFKRWAGVTYDWIRAKNGNAERKGIALIETLIKSGKRVFVAATSKQQAKRIYQTLERLSALNGKRVLRAFESDNDDENNELTAAKNNYSRFNRYEVVIASPTVGTGVSIDTIEGALPNFDRVVCFMTRHKHAPDAESAMQMPFRVRQTRDNHIHLIECDFASHGKPITSWESRRDFKRLKALAADLAKDFLNVDDRSKYLKHFISYNAYRSVVECNDSAAFDNYYNLIDRELASKGMMLLEAGEIDANTVLADAALVDDVTTKTHPALMSANKLAREILKAEPVNAIINAPVLPPEQLEAVEAKLAFVPDSVTYSDKMAVKKAHIIAAYHPADDTTPNEDQLRDYIDAEAKGLAAARNRLANALLTKYDIQAIQRAWVSTDSKRKKDATSLDALRIAANRNIDSALADLIGLTLADDVYSLSKQSFSADDVTSKDDGRSISRRLGDALDDFNATNPEHRLNRKKLNESPLEFVAALIRKRFKLAIRKNSNDGYDIATQQEVIDNLNLTHKKNGAVGLNRLLAAIRLDESLGENGELSPETCKRLGIDAEVQHFLTKSFASIPQKLHKPTLISYLRIAESGRAKGDQFSPVARANHYIHDVLKRTKTERLAA